MNNVVFGRYQNKDTLVHKLDVRVKLFLMIALMVLVFLPFKAYSFAFLFLFLIISLVIAKVNFISIYRVVKPMRFMFIILLIINVLTIREGRVLFDINNFLVYDTPIYQTVYIVFRIIMLLMISTLLTSTSKPTELTYGIRFYLKPLTIFKINTHEIAIMISIALRFIPTLLEETNKIMKSQTSRGVDFKYGKFKEKTLGITSLIVPLFVSSFEKADDLAIAMLSRGYDSDKARSEYRRFKIGRKDVMSTLVFIVFTAVYFLLRRYTI